MKMICERVRRNNGLVEALFSRHPDISNKRLQEEHVLINVMWELDQFEEGKEYLIDIRPAFPH